MRQQKRYYVKFFSGFLLQDEEDLFREYLSSDINCVAGFSYGAQKAFEYVYHSQERIDKLILLSPAFFQTQKKSFIRAQLRYFKSEKEAYITQFLQNVSYPSTINLSPYLKKDHTNTLESLLNYQWDKRKLEEIIQRGIIVEIFIGLKDKIIPSKDVLSFFDIGTTYLIKDAGHLLKELS